MEENGRVVGVAGLEGEEFRARWTLFADGAHTSSPRTIGQRRHIDTLMGWWRDELRARDGSTWRSMAS